MQDLHVAQIETQQTCVTYVYLDHANHTYI